MPNVIMDLIFYVLWCYRCSVCHTYNNLKVKYVKFVVPLMERIDVLKLSACVLQVDVFLTCVAI